MSNIFQKLEQDFENGFHNAETWLVGEFKYLRGTIAPIVVTAVNDVQAAEASGVLPAIAAALSPVTKGLSVAINNAIEAGLPKAVAIALGIEDLPDSPTPAQVAAFGQAVLNAIGGSSLALKGTWETNLAAQIYGLLQAAIAANAGTTVEGTLTFAQVVVLVEKAFQDATTDKAAAAAGESVAVS